MLRAVIARLGAAALVAGLGVVALPGPPAGAYQPWGTAVSTNKVLKPRCHHYPFRYRINAPSDDWAAEIFLTNPRGVGIASQALLSNADPDRGRASWRFCRNSTSYGRYKIRMKITYHDENGDNHAGFVRPTYFRMVRPPNR